MVLNLIVGLVSACTIERRIHKLHTPINKTNGNSGLSLAFGQPDYWNIHQSNISNVCKTKSFVLTYSRQQRIICMLYDISYFIFISKCRNWVGTSNIWWVELLLHNWNYSFCLNMSYPEMSVILQNVMKSQSECYNFLAYTCPNCYIT